MRSVSVSPGQVIMSIAATVGRPIIVGIDACIHDGFVVFDRHPRLDPGFLVHHLCQMGPYFTGQGQTGTQANINTQIVEASPLQLPCLAEQRAIAAVLDTIDDAIQKTEQIIAKLQQVKHGLLHDLLTRGIDDNGELRDPERHPEQFQDSPLGRIPKGWEVKPFGKCFWLQRGFDITVAEQRTGNVPVVSSSGISSYHDKPMVEGPGVVTGRKGKLGAAYYVSVPFWPHDTSLWVKDFFGNDREFACLFIGSFRLERFDAATSVPTLNRNTVHPLLIALPRLAEQRLIVEKQQAIDIRIAIENREHSKLSALKSSLGDDLLTGRVRTTSLPGFSA